MATENSELLATIPTPKLDGKRITTKDILGFQTPYLQERAKLSSGISGAEAKAEKAKQEQAEIQSMGELSAATKQTADVQKAQDTYQEGLRKEPLPAFIPSQENAQDLAALFSVVNVIGMLVGGGGKQNAQAAMSAMNGMLEGHQKGRDDLYKREKDVFEKNFKAMLKRHEELRKEMEDAVKLSAVNKEQGILEAKMAAVKSGSSIVNAMVEKGMLVSALDVLNGAEKGATHAMDTVLKMQQKADTDAAAERRHREDMAQRERIAKEQMSLREKLAKAAATAKVEAAKKGGTLKPGAKITEGYVADTILKNDIEDLKKDLQNPKLVEMLKQYRVEAFLTEEGKVLNQLITSDIPNDLQKFLVKVRDIRNNYYLTISGKAVTGGEALRNYGTVPQPGDDLREITNKLDGMISRVNNTIQLKRQLFGLPELSLVPGMKTNLKPNDDYSINSQTTYEINKVYTDKNGIKAKYLGNDEWEEIE